MGDGVARAMALRVSVITKTDEISSATASTNSAEIIVNFVLSRSGFILLGRQMK